MPVLLKRLKARNRSVAGFLTFARRELDGDFPVLEKPANLRPAGGGLGVRQLTTMKLERANLKYGNKIFITEMKSATDPGFTPGDHPLQKMDQPFWLDFV